MILMLTCQQTKSNYDVTLDHPHIRFVSECCRQNPEQFPTGKHGNAGTETETEAETTERCGEPEAVSYVIITDLTISLVLTSFG